MTLLSRSFTSSSTTTINNTVGACLSKGGVDFIAEAKVTISTEYIWAKAAAQSTSTTITDSTTLTVTGNIGQQPGTNAFSHSRQHILAGASQSLVVRGIKAISTSANLRLRRTKQGQRVNIQSCTQPDVLAFEEWIGRCATDAIV